jgi:hypothetical protein
MPDQNSELSFVKALASFLILGNTNYQGFERWRRSSPVKLRGCALHKCPERRGLLLNQSMEGLNDFTTRDVPFSQW